MKAQVKIVDTIGILGVIMMILVFFTQIFPRIIGLIIDTFSRTCAETVSRQLASFITVSGVSTYKVEINYIPTKSVTYNVDSKGRKVTVTPNYEVAYAEKSSSTQPYAVPLKDFNFEKVNFFTITKTFENGESHYTISAKEEQE